MSKWSICSNCGGDGFHSKHLGIITVEDWDQESLDEYMNGSYDSPCEVCNKTGKVLSENNHVVKYFSNDTDYFHHREGN